MTQDLHLDIVVSRFKCSCCCKDHLHGNMMEHSMLEVSEEGSCDITGCYKWRGNDNCYHHCMEIVLWLYKLATIFY